MKPKTLLDRGRKSAKGKFALAGDTPANRSEQSFSFTPQVARGRATSRGDFRLRQFGMHTTRRFLFAAETAASRLVAAGFHVPAIFIAPVRDALPQLDNLTYFRNPKFIAPARSASARTANAVGRQHKQP